MGVAAFNIASGVLLITAQRLARRLCASLQATIRHSGGCATHRRFKGQTSMAPGRPTVRWDAMSARALAAKGRVGIYDEVMPITGGHATDHHEQWQHLDIAAQAKREGVRNLRESDCSKVKQGVTSLEEIEAVTKCLIDPASATETFEEELAYGNRRANPARAARPTRPEVKANIFAWKAPIALVKKGARRNARSSETVVANALRRQGVKVGKIKSRPSRAAARSAKGDRPLLRGNWRR